MDIIDTNFNIIRTYYDDGKLEEEYFEINKNKHGLYTLYNTTKHKGNIIRTIQYMDGKKHGEYKSYSDDGYVEYICYYKHNIKEGPATFYYTNGQIDNECNFVNGVINGMRIWYFNDGILKKKCNHVNGLRQGECIIYNHDGSIKNIWNYVDDEIVQ